MFIPRETSSLPKKLQAFLASRVHFFPDFFPLYLTATTLYTSIITTDKYLVEFQSTPRSFRTTSAGLFSSNRSRCSQSGKKLSASSFWQNPTDLKRPKFLPGVASARSARSAETEPISKSGLTQPLNDGDDDDDASDAGDAYVGENLAKRFQTAKFFCNGLFQDKEKSFWAKKL